MVATTVHVHVKAGHVEEFIAASLENHRHSVLEEGNLRFDILQQRDDPSRFTLFEVYRTDADIAKHKETAHYLRWKAIADPIMDTPRKGVAHTVLAPLEEPKWKC